MKLEKITTLKRSAHVIAKTLGYRFKDLPNVEILKRYFDEKHNRNVIVLRISALHPVKVRQHGPSSSSS
jgi:hypothetical protein